MELYDATVLALLHQFRCLVRPRRRENKYLTLLLLLLHEVRFDRHRRHLLATSWQSQAAIEHGVALERRGRCALLKQGGATRELFVVRQLSVLTGVRRLRDDELTQWLRLAILAWNKTETVSIGRHGQIPVRNTEHLDGM